MKPICLLIVIFTLSSCRTGFREIDLHRNPSSAYFHFKSWGTPAEYPGGLMAWSQLLKEKRARLQAPCESGIVSVNFKVTKTGTLDSLRVVSSVCDLADKNALDIVSSSSPWLPAIKDSVIVSSWVTVNIPYHYSTRD